MTAAIERCELDLNGFSVLTEAAVGAYAITPVMAAMAGARVHALANGTRYADSDNIREVTLHLARVAGVARHIEFLSNKNPDVMATVDIVTNSGQVRPIDARMIRMLKPTAVISLMYESWEYREADVDLVACRRRGIPVAGVNERDPAVDVFSFLGSMAIKQLHDAGVAVYKSRVLLVCDNDFGPFIDDGLRRCGADVARTKGVTSSALSKRFDAVLVVMKPHGEAVIGEAEARLLQDRAPGTPVVQYWGDVDRVALETRNVPVWPAEPPSAGHMAILPSAIGPEPIVRLQSGGLKVGEVLARGGGKPSDWSDLVQLL